jgi:cupin 2 domain-containing protein
MRGDARLPMKSENLFAGIPAELSEELLTTVHRGGAVRIERIVSQGQSSPDGFWYDQDEDEWVIVLEGSAAVEFEGEVEPVQLQRGSYLNIPAHARHRVAWTDPHQQTVWLAVHYRT